MKGLVGYLVYRFLAAGFGRLPRPVVQWIGRTVGRVWYYISKDRRKLATSHMRRVLGPDGNARAEAKRMFGYYGQYWAEVFWVRPKHRERLLEVTEPHGAEYAYEALAEGNGLIFALPHMGNWDFGGSFAAHVGFPVLAVAEALSNERIVDWFIKVRNGLGIDIVIIRPGSGVTKALVRRLREGGTVALLCDRDVSGGGVDVEFFGEKTTLPAGPVALADRTGAPIIPVGTFYLDDGGFAFTGNRRVELPKAETREERIRLGTQELAYRLEELIRQAPAQWHLLVPNWPSDRGSE